MVGCFDVAKSAFEGVRERSSKVDTRKASHAQFKAGRQLAHNGY